MKKPYNILITNDDGYKASGIEALYEAYKDIYNVYMVAPANEQSAKSQAISPRSTLHASQKSEFIYTIDGTPADCVHIATTGLLSHIKFDLVLSGINLGPNFSDDVFYSGTVGAAFEGALRGISSIAFSYENTKGKYIKDSAIQSIPIVEKVLNQGLPSRTILNVNFPDLPKEQVKGIQWTHLGTLMYELSLKQSENKTESYWKYGDYVGYIRKEKSDCHACHTGYISISPLVVSCYNESVSRQIEDLYRF